MLAALASRLQQPGRICTGRRAAGPTPGECRLGQWVPKSGNVPDWVGR